MKKLLSLLSVLTISGTAIPTTIAASPYQKEKQLNSDINYLQTINLETLNRNKRQSRRILDIDENLIIKEYEKESYKSSMEKIISLLVSNNIFISIFESNENQQRSIYELNQNINYDYFNISVSITTERNETRNITLVFRIRDLYLLGFINNGHYYYFAHENDEISGRNSRTNEQLESSINSRHQEIIDLRNNNNLNGNNDHTNLRYTGHYNNIMGEGDQAIYWNSIYSSFFEISNTGIRFQSQTSVVQAALGRIILVTSESLRFRSIYNLIIDNIINNNAGGPIYWNPGRNSGQVNVRDIVTNWQSLSNSVIETFNNFREEFGRNTYILLSQLPVNRITVLLNNSNIIRVILGLVIQPALNCGNRRRPRSINNDIKNEYCDAIKGNEENYPLENKKVTAIKILDENNSDKNLKKGDILEFLHNILK